MLMCTCWCKQSIADSYGSMARKGGGTQLTYSADLQVVFDVPIEKH